MSGVIFKKSWWMLGLFTALVGCSGQAPQTSGIVAITRFEAIACVGQDKILTVRNESLTEPQRVQGIFFEKGTNDSNYFKIVEVNANGKIKPISGGIAEEILIPAGGTITIVVNYNPKKVTFGEEYHDTYLDVLLNGPKLGVMQLELRGTSPAMLEGCGEQKGDLQTFQVEKVLVKIADKDVNGGTVAVQENLDIPGVFEFSVEGEVATLTKDGFPSIPIETPGLTVEADLDDETYVGSFDGSVLNFEEVILQTSGIEVAGRLTTDSFDYDSGEGVISLQGSPLADGKMVVVFAGTLPDIALLEGLRGGAIGAEIYLTAQ